MKKTYLSHNKKKNLADWPELSLERNEGERDLDLSQADFFFFYTGDFVLLLYFYFIPALFLLDFFVFLQQSEL